MELVVFVSGFRPESYEVSSLDEALQVLRDEWHRISQFRGFCVLYGDDGSEVAHRSWKENDNLVGGCHVRRSM